MKNQVSNAFFSISLFGERSRQQKYITFSIIHRWTKKPKIYHSFTVLCYFITPEVISTTYFTEKRSIDPFWRPFVVKYWSNRPPFVVAIFYNLIQATDRTLPDSLKKTLIFLHVYLIRHSIIWSIFGKFLVNLNRETKVASITRSNVHIFGCKWTCQSKWAL